MHTALARSAAAGLSLAALAALAAASRAQTDAEHARVAPEPALRAHTHFERVLHDRLPDGTELARGASWKAAFDASGATFVPFLGSAAPRNFPLHLRVQSLVAGGEPVALDAQAAAQRTGETIRYARGGLLERYELASDSIEQSFVVPALPASGELVLTLAFDSELVPVQAEDGLEFRGEHGGVRYGRASAVDAAGARLELETVLEESTLSIRVPAAFADGAVLPLTIDPVIATLSMHTGAADDFAPDVAFDASADCYLVVWEEVYSASDHDVYAERYHANGSVVLSTLDTIDFSTAYWARPRVANDWLASSFLVVAEVGDPVGGAREIRGRLRMALNDAQTGQFTISGAEAGDKSAPDVGGDPTGDPSSGFCVVWQRSLISSDSDIHMQFLEPIGGGKQFASTLFVDNTGATLDELPSIAHSCGAAGVFNIAWQRLVAPGNHDLRVARVDRSGTLLTPSTAVTNGANDERNPSASCTLPGTGHWTVACEVGSGTDHDVVARLLNGAVSLHAVNVNGLEAQLGSPNIGEDQIHPAVACDGDHFVIAYAESYQGSALDYSVMLDTLGEVGGQLFLAEGPRITFVTPSREDQPQLCTTSEAGGAVGRALAVFENSGTASLGNVLGALYDSAWFTSFCFPGFDAVSCPCTNPPSVAGRGCANSGGTGGAKLDAAGQPSLALDSVVFSTSGEKPTATSIVLQGSAVTNQVFGMGVRCAGGVLKRLYTKTASAGAISAPAPGDPSVSARSAALGDALSAGATRYYLVYYRDPVVMGGCPATSTFNATQSGAVTWRP